MFLTKGVPSGRPAHESAPTTGGDLASINGGPVLQQTPPQALSKPGVSRWIHATSRKIGTHVDLPLPKPLPGSTLAMESLRRMPSARPQDEAKPVAALDVSLTAVAPVLVIPVREDVHRLGQTSIERHSAKREVENANVDAEAVAVSDGGAALGSGSFAPTVLQALRAEYASRQADLIQDITRKVARSALGPFAETDLISAVFSIVTGAPKDSGGLREEVALARQSEPETEVPKRAFDIPDAAAMPGRQELAAGKGFGQIAALQSNTARQPQPPEQDYSQRRTNAAKQLDVIAMLRTNPELPAREMARRCGVSPQTVLNWRERLRGQ